ncbi:Hypothetical Protein FCC1311_081422 [Hondaea fermentalgiana]|uniref:Uncharacterized protein n=1 Tax=Hondaea fermentalgiana TaxID=2315210 RepID=A0A2R5GM10_9STRA|nr:Hypothetical Protein FCC1311_081422 [Hondaea fermentalgiana]|eukprot:GBG31917.1 Hypothetical Protein FCC1311_081422 [Hondaea fermentalgiana]
MAEENAALRELREDMKSMKAELRKVQQKQSVRRRGSTSTLSRRLSTQIDELTRSAQVDVPALRQEIARLTLDKNSLELELEVLRKGADLAKREFAVDASLRTELEASLSTIRNAIEDVAGVPAHARKALEESLARLAKRQEEACMDDLLSSDTDLMSSTSREDKAEDKDRWTLHLISRLEQRLESLEDGTHVRIAPAQQSSGDSKVVTDSIVMNKKKLEELRKAKSTTAGSQEDVEHEDTDNLLQLGSRDSFDAPPILRDPSLSPGKEAENSLFDEIEPQEKKVGETDDV